MTEGQTAWRAVSAVPFDTRVLLALDTGEIVVGYRSIDPAPDGAWFFQDGLNSINPPPLAWMPLPAPPVAAIAAKAAAPENQP